MNVVRRLANALIAGGLFFALELVIAIVLGYVVLWSRRLPYDFYLVLKEGVRFGAYLGGVITVLAFMGGPRRKPPFL